ncbi:MAG: hypothetical protein IKS48_11105 [Eubacterium sp.]|nr:hypothetical protein [Eubacterium sp.]
MKNEINTFRHRLSFKVLLTVFTVFLTMAFMISDVSAGSSKFEVAVSATKNVDGETFIVTLDVTNKGSDFKGLLRTMVKTDYSFTTAFDVDIAVPAGSTKQYSVTVPVKYITTTDRINVSIFDKNGKEVYMNQYTSVFSSYSGAIRQGILSDKPDDLTILDMGGERFKINNENYVIDQLVVDGATLKDNLKEMDMLVIDNYDTSTLSEETRNQINAWVEQGGMLILGTGKGAERVLSGFNDGADIDVSFQNYGINSTKFYSSGQFYDLDTAYLMYGDSYYYCTNDYMRCCRLDNGSVTIISFDIKDFAMENAYRNEALGDVYRDAYGNTAKSGGIQANVMAGEEIKNAQGYMEKPAKTGNVMIRFLIMTYAVLVGPGIYLILKALKKREYIWIAIPALSLVFVGLIFLTGMGVKVRGRVVDSVNVIYLSQNKKDTYVFGYSPKAENWEMTAKGDYDYATSIPDNYYSDSDDPCGSVNKKSDSVLLNAFPNRTFQTKGFVLTSSIDNQGSIDFEVDTSANKSVKNNTNVKFDYLLVITQNGYQLIDSVDPGKSIPLNLKSFNSNYGLRSEIQNLEANPAYVAKDYDKAAAIAAMTVALDENLSDAFTAVGVVKSESITDLKEKSWTCYVVR